MFINDTTKSVCADYRELIINEMREGSHGGGYADEGGDGDGGDVEESEVFQSSNLYLTDWKSGSLLF